MTNIGFKKLTVDNWIEPDKVSSSFVGISTVDGQVHTISGNEWVSHILKPNLIEAVPTEIRALFEVARGALAYGYFFYPLYTLAGEQLFRVAETAVNLKCKEMGAPRSKDTFQQKVNYLIQIKAIPQQKKETWNAIRRLRNMASHPELQSILPPGPVIGIVEGIANEINSLFSGA